ncbi:MAG: hypothetical protein H5U40_10385, partial [Polyangiaceae bacterium]|nr:hypothetical protein [Polyangiaceae bacterium]
LSTSLPDEERSTQERGALLRIDGDDALPADDSAAVLLRAPAGTRVLLVNGDPRPMPIDDEVGFAVRAIGLGASEQRGGFRARVVDPASAGVSDLEWADVVVLANVDLAPGRFADQLLRAVEGGTGLLVTGGDRVRPSRLDSALGAALPARIEDASGARAAAGLFEPSPSGVGPVLPGLENASFSRRNELEPRVGSAKVETVFADGRPALVTGVHGRGQVAMLAIPLDDDFGDLPYRPGYLPMLDRLLRTLSGGALATSEHLMPGEALNLERFTRLGPLDVIAPSGRRTTLGEDGETELRATSEAGIYRVERAGRDVPEAAFVVQAPLAESDLASEGPPEVAPAGAMARSGGTLKRPLAPWCFLLAALLFAAEGFARQRWRGALVRTSTRARGTEAGTDEATKMSSAPAP